MMIIIIIYYYNYYLLLLLLLYMYIYIYILITTQLGFLSRVCLIGGRTCLFIGRDQPKVVLPNIFWGMWVLINSGVIINMILTSASYGSQPLGFSHMIFSFQLQECRWWWKVTLGHFFWKTIGQCLKVTSSNQNLFRAYQAITYRYL